MKSDGTVNAYTVMRSRHMNHENEEKNQQNAGKSPNIDAAEKRISFSQGR